MATERGLRERTDGRADGQADGPNRAKIALIIIFVNLWSTDRNQHIDDKMQYAMGKLKVSTSF